MTGRRSGNGLRRSGARPSRGARLLLPAVSTVALLLVLVTVLAPAPATAHVELLSAKVVTGASGRELVLAFSASVAPGFSTVRVIDDAGSAVLTEKAVRDPADRKHVRLSLGGLGPGTYTASYRVVAQDGHVLAGGAAFTIPGGATTTTQTPPSTSPTPNTWDATDIHLTVTGAGGGGSGPSELVLEFPGMLLPDGNVARVLTTGRKVVVAGPGRVGSNPGTLSLSLQGLAPGWYTVTWRVTGKARTGSVGEAVFEVKATGAPPAGGGGTAAGPDRPDRVARAAQMPLRALGFVGAALLGGSMVFGLAVWRPTALLDPALPAADSVIGARLRWTALAGAVIVLLATPAFLVTEAADAADVSLLQAIGDPVWRFMGTTTGLADLARTALAAAALVLVVILPARLTGAVPRRWWAMLALTAALLLTFSLASHASTSRPAPVNIIVDWVHLAAMAGWVGGLVGLALARSPVSRLAGPGGPWLAVMRRFSTLAGVGVGVMVTTGLYAVLVSVGALHGLTSSSYGQTLLIKLWFVAGLVGLGGVNRFLLIPELEEQGGSEGMRWTVTLEVVLGAAVLGAVGVLTTLSPA